MAKQYYIVLQQIVTPAAKGKPRSALKVNTAVEMDEKEAERYVNSKCLREITASEASKKKKKAAKKKAKDDE